MAEAGRPTLLTDEMCIQIRGHVLDGKTIDEICSLCGMSPLTWRDWHYTNYLGFADKVRTWKLERMTEMARGNVPELLKSSDEKVKTDITKFVLQHVDRSNFHTRTETELSGGVKLYKWDGYENNSPVQTETVDEGTARESEAVEGSCVTSPVGENSGSTESPDTGSHDGEQK